MVAVVLPVGSVTLLTVKLVWPTVAPGEKSTSSVMEVFAPTAFVKPVIPSVVAVPLPVVGAGVL